MPINRAAVPPVIAIRPSQGVQAYRATDSDRARAAYLLLICGADSPLGCAGTCGYAAETREVRWPSGCFGRSIEPLAATPPLESAGPHGTYWRSGSGLLSHVWSTVDQVLLRPGALTCYDPPRLLVIDRVGERPILHLGKTGTGLSDHLPCVVGLSIERELSGGRRLLGHSRRRQHPYARHGQWQSRRQNDPPAKDPA